MALALYRKYRPATFSDVVGQEHVTTPLMHALNAGRINHAYLFSGPRGCGKTSSARILARSLNCVDGPTATPCGVCDSCVALAPDGPGSIDVIEIDAASHGGVDDARDLRERAFFAPVNSRYKVYVIDEAHMVSTQGFNALLKLVEEPPDFVVFVFATTEPDKVLPTIRSRTHHYPFRLLPPSVMRALIEKLCAAEGVSVEPAVLPLVIRAGGGSARDSLSVLDQLFAGAGDAGVTYQHALGLLGVTDVALLDDIVDALAANDGATVFETVDRVVEAGHDPRRFAADLLDRLRDLVILDAVPDAAAKGLIDVPGEELERMSGQAPRLGAATLSRLADVIHDGLTEMRGTTSPRLVLELLCARMLLPATSSDAAALLQRVERLERRQAIAVDNPAEAQADRPARQPARPAERPKRSQPARSAPVEQDGGSVPAAAAAEPDHAEPAQPDHAESADSDRAHHAEPAPAASAAAPAEQAAPASEQPAQPAQPAESVQSAASPAPETAAPPAAGTELDAAAVRRVWPEVMEKVKSASRRTQALLQNATVSRVDGSTLILVASTPPLARLLAEESNLAHTRDALRTVLGVDWRVRAVPPGADGAPGDSGRAGPTPGQPEPRQATPPPAEPDPRDDEPEDDGSSAAPEQQRRDPESAALSLLKDTLGAEAIE
jgi:DNA polymerase III subunit gamma/tau